jgi:hypothetical protein
MKTQAWKVVSRLAVIVLAVYLFPAAAGAEAKLLAHWKFNQSGEDASGNGRDAALKSGATYATDAVEGSHCLLLEGRAYATVGAFDLGDAFTITAWTYLMPGMTDIQTLIANCEGGSRINGFKLFVNNWETNNKCIIVEPSDGTDRIDIQSPENTYEEALWNHVAMTVDRVNGVIDLYFNGIRVTETNLTVSGFQVTRPVFIGAMPPGNSYNWQGMIDDLRVYAGILTEDEISDTMNPPSAVEEPSSGHASQPGGFLLRQNHPNPFNPVTRITYSLSRTSSVSLNVFDQRGHLAAVLAEGIQASGIHEALFYPNHLPAGIYYCRLQAGPSAHTIKMLYLK